MTVYRFGQANYIVGAGSPTHFASLTPFRIDKDTSVGHFFFLQNGSGVSHFECRSLNDFSKVTDIF
jgi:hypothetical protein